MMKWDAVEREMIVVGTQLRALGRSFQVLAAELAKEKDAANLAGSEEAVTQMATKKGGRYGDLPF